MKKSLILAIALGFCLSPLAAYAQHGPHKGGKQEPRPDITELVSDLTTSQKRKLETITSESKVRIDRLRNQQKAVRDSINIYMEREGDQSKILFPLFEREARLQTEVSREMYSAKVKIDQVLTKEQRGELQKCNQKHRHKKAGR